jgi:hypothetical protein
MIPSSAMPQAKADISTFYTVNIPVCTTVQKSSGLGNKSFQKEHERYF